MSRWKLLLLLAMCAAFVAPMSAQFNNNCMDCTQKWRTFIQNGTLFTEVQALCCHLPCAGGWALQQPDVGWGCLIAQMPSGSTTYGTECASSDADLGCPDPLEPLPPVTPKPRQDQPPSNPDGGPESPILLDLGDEGYRLTSVSGGVQFDLRGEGRRVQTAWTRLGVENAFLALDRNGNGRIDDGAELFGNFTPLLAGGVAPNGFVALEEYDANHDGVIDSADPIWARLILWTDRNHDGLSTNDELQPIAESIVQSLETDHRLTRKKDQWGNEFRYLSHFQFQRGMKEKSRAYYDVFFRTGE